MNLADISIRRPVMMTMVVMSFVVLGLFSLTRLGIDTFPEIDFPFVIATVVYPGTGPQEMETLIAKPIEEQVSSIGGIKNVTSISQEGITIVMCEFNLEVQVDFAAIDVKDKIDAIRQNLPEDMFDPIIQKFDFGALPVMTLALSSPRPLEETYKIADDDVKQRLARINGLANIELTGGREREIQVNLNRRKLNSYNLTPQEVIGMIAAHNLNIPAGLVEQGRKEISVRMQGEFTNLDEIRNIDIPIGDGKNIKIKDIGWVDDDFTDQRDRAYFNGESSVGINLVKRSDANTVAVAKDIYKELEKIKNELPSDVVIAIARDRSTFIQDSVNDIFGNIIVGILLTIVVLLMFLHSLPITVIVAVSMPTSIISTFILIDFAGFTLNFMSLLGLAISVGTLVANSIVIIENIQRYRDQGLPLAEASSKGTNEIAIAVIASTLTNIVVFAPMAFMSGIVGRFFIQFGLTVSFATLFSLLVSFTLTPMLASRPIKAWLYVVMGLGLFAVLWWRMGVDTALLAALIVVIGLLANSFGWLRNFPRLWNSFFNGVTDDYRSSLKWAMRHKALVLVITTLMFIGSLVLAGGGFIGSEFFPRTDTGTFSISLKMPVGSVLDETDRTLSEIARRVMSEKYVRTVYAATGVSEGGDFTIGQAANLGVLVVQMVDQDKRPVSTNELIDKLRPNLTDFPGAKITMKQIEAMGGGAEADLQIEVTGYEIDKLLVIADSLMAYMKEMEGLVNVKSSWDIGKPELHVIPNRERLADQGIPPATLGQTVRFFVEGEVASKFRETGDEYDIRVQLDPNDITRAEDVSSMYVKAGDFQRLVSELSTTKYEEGPTSISRKNKRRLVTVTADVASGTVGQFLDILGKKTDEMKLPAGYSIFYGGEAEMMGEAFAELFKALALAIVLTFMLLAAILESMKHPFTIMMTFPLGLIGVLVSLFVTGNSISLFSLMALVMLVGIVVNNGILLIDYIMVLRAEGRKIDDAIIEACPVRLRPIIMSNVATALGVLPLALGLGSGAEFRAPMGIVTIGGLMSSTVFTLYVVPVMYRLLEKKEE